MWLMRKLMRAVAVLALFGSVSALSACDSGSKPSGPVVNVYAAASLKQAFTALADRYEKDNLARTCSSTSRARHRWWNS